MKFLYLWTFSSEIIPLRGIDKPKLKQEIAERLAEIEKNSLAFSLRSSEKIEIKYGKFHVDTVSVFLIDRIAKRAYEVWKRISSTSSRTSLIDCLIESINKTFLHELLHAIEPSLTESQVNNALFQLKFG